MAADRAEAEYDRLLRIRSSLGGPAHTPGDLEEFLKGADNTLRD